MNAPISLQLVSVKVEPRTVADEPMLRDALADIVQRDVGLSFPIDAESRETIIHGESEPKLDSAIAELRQRGIGVSLGPVVIEYRETITGPIEIDFLASSAKSTRAAARSVIS